MTTEILTKTTVDCSTGEVTIEPLTAEEIADKEQRHAEYEAREKAREEQMARIATLKESAKAKLVAGEPLTEEEAATIVL
jgi:hypothetical protein